MNATRLNGWFAMTEKFQTFVKVYQGHTQDIPCDLMTLAWTAVAFSHEDATMDSNPANLVGSIVRAGQSRLLGGKKSLHADEDKIALRNFMGPCFPIHIQYCIFS